MSDEPRQITQGLLDALILTPIADPGEAPKSLDIKVQGLPGFGATLDIAAVQELRQALDVILGPQSTPDLAMLLRRYFEASPVTVRGSRSIVQLKEYRELDEQLRRLVGAPSKVWT